MLAKGKLPRNLTLLGISGGVKVGTLELCSPSSASWQDRKQPVVVIVLANTKHQGNTSTQMHRSKFPTHRMQHGAEQWSTLLKTMFANWPRFTQFEGVLRSDSEHYKTMQSRKLSLYDRTSND